MLLNFIKVFGDEKNVNTEKHKKIIYNAQNRIRLITTKLKQSRSESPLLSEVYSERKGSNYAVQSRLFRLSKNVKFCVELVGHLLTTILLVNTV